jgi:hypothetical protein
MSTQKTDAKPKLGAQTGVRLPSGQAMYDEP